MSTTRAIRHLVIKYWDYFCAEGAKRTILDYEFAIDTGASPPICCRNPTYGPHKKSIIMEQISSLLDNDWIVVCGGSWGTQIVLSAKPHQEHIDDMNKFIWRMCVSYRGLNKVTKLYEYLIPCCDTAVKIFQMGSSKMWIITADAKQGYHQAMVRKYDVEKLDFFAPNHKKYTFKVMPFGPVNAPAFYTCTMGNFKVEWDTLFIELMIKLATYGSKLGNDTLSHAERV